jgi:hypothetical protein
MNNESGACAPPDFLFFIFHASRSDAVILHFPAA